MELIAEKESRLRVQKIFLLVFHGGLVAYLYLHNLLLPGIKNLGRGEFLLTNVQLFFLPQSWLFFEFLRTNFSHPVSGRALLALTCNFFILLASIPLYFSQLRDGVSVSEFSTGISLVSIALFFLGFFLRFKKYFACSFAIARSHYLIGAILGIVFSWFHHSYWATWVKANQKMTPHFSRQQNHHGPVVEIDLPSQEYFSGDVIIGPEGIVAPYAFIAATSSLMISNQSGHKQHLRVEYIKNNRWYFKGILNLASGQKESFPFHEQGIYRLKLLNFRQHGIFAIVIGSESFAPGRYRIGPKGIEKSGK